MTLFNFSLILINTLILVAGQFLWKFGMLQNPLSFHSINSIIKSLISPFILSGLFLYGLATILWLFILTKVPLSVAYPLQSLAYVFAIFGSSVFFNEPITISKVIGVLFIMMGVSIIGLYSSH